MDAKVASIFDKDARIERVVLYPEGFVPLAYKWPCPRKRTVHYRDGRQRVESYDAKRRNGRGPSWVAYSARGGRLAMGG